jgi:hypothetical protein
MNAHDELKRLIVCVHDELGEDAYEGACRSAMASAQKREPRAMSSPSARTVDVGLNEPYIILESAYLEHLRTELRRLLTAH